MKNPFEAFHHTGARKREIPLDTILKSKEETLSKILTGYEDLLKNEAKDLVWLMQYSTVIKAYSIAERGIEGLEYTAEDIEEFCYALDHSDQIPYLITGPAGIYISALPPPARPHRQDQSPRVPPPYQQEIDGAR